MKVEPEKAFPILNPKPEEIMSVEEDTSGLLILDCGATSNLVGADTVLRAIMRALRVPDIDDAPKG